ncbi:MAG: cysteine--tRNA ligase [Oscillospiraceae bacterium]|nr:cysteine--tRNA ligase [Oscillospiraceae bacterium]MDD4367901.1 cysteine--tRNA ligase [Oscillospiraceae bacterium]
MKIYNTMTRQKEEFVPVEAGKVKIYVCGPTVYDYFHLGNARPFITFDTLRRYLEYKGYKVTFVQNFTDIDDKVINRANLQHVSTKDLSEHYIREYYIDADGLNVERADFQPRATDTIPEIIKMIQTLIDKGYAYVSDDGVYFSTHKFPEYGKLSGYNVEDLEEGAGNRALNGESKQHPSDFALWKRKKEGEPYWESPWGEGRPGWHIECSAMAFKYLGETIDIHGGGQDLVFPHHENEIAQSEACSGHVFAKYWMHNGFINIDNAKMAKSKGNFFTVRDLAKHYDYMVIRFFMLNCQYRSPINFSRDLLNAAQTGWERIVTCIENARFYLDQATGQEAVYKKSGLADKSQAAVRAFETAMDDDLNTADAMAAIFDFVRDINTAVVEEDDQDPEELRQALATLLKLLDVLGLKIPQSGAIPEEITALVRERSEAKVQHNYQLADDIRTKIEAAGYQVEDTPQGPKVSAK